MLGRQSSRSSGNVYVGVAIDLSSRAFYAEQAAVAAMVTAGEYDIRRFVAVWRDSRPGADPTLFVIPPCGVCRQFVVDLAAVNLDAPVVTSPDDEVALRSLLPLHGWSAQPVLGGLESK